HDEQIERLETVQRAIDGAKALPKVNTPEEGSAARAREPARVTQKDLPKGTLFARYAMAVAAGRGSISDTLEYAKRWNGQTPEVAQYIRATAGSATPVSPGWGSELAEPDTLVSEFIELLMPATVIGRIQGFDRVPFNVRILEQVGGSTVNWVGELAAKP